MDADAESGEDTGWEKVVYLYGGFFFWDFFCGVWCRGVDCRVLFVDGVLYKLLGWVASDGL